MTKRDRAESPTPEGQGMDLEGEPAPLKIADLQEQFRKWLTKGGEDSRARFAARVDAFLREPWPDDISACLEVQARISTCLAWVNGQLADAAHWLRIATALYTEDAARDRNLQRLQEGARNRIVGGRTAQYARVLKALERLGATATHQLDGIRTRISAEKVLLELTIYGSTGKK